MNQFLTPKIRFKNYTKPWKKVTLADISIKITTKNNSSTKSYPVYTNSAKYGIINQQKYFDRKIARNITGYYIIKQDDFIYNPRISKEAPYGPIRRNKNTKTGVISPLYYPFKLIKEDKTFIEQYFKTNKWYKFMYSHGNTGVRSDRFSISDKTLQKMPIYVPQDKTEQEKIGNLLNTLDELIKLEPSQVSKIKQFRKFLYQNMFI